MADPERRAGSVRPFPLLRLTERLLGEVGPACTHLLACIRELQLDHALADGLVDRIERQQAAGKADSFFVRIALHRSIHGEHQDGGVVGEASCGAFCQAVPSGRVVG